MEEEAKKKLIMFTIKDLVKKTGISARTWHRYIKQGELKASKVGKSFLIYPHNFHKFIESKEIKREKKK